MNHPIKICLFIRVSSDLQNVERQLRELTEYCEQRSYQITKTISTTITGKKEGKNRPDIQELFASANNKIFSKVLVTEISRLGRKARDIRATIDYLHSRKISVIFKNLGGLESLDENGNETFVTNIIIGIYSELAQEETRILGERTKSGLVLAVKKGRTLGRPQGQADSKSILKQYSKLANDLKEGLSLNQCMKLHSVSKNTVIKPKSRN
jgi:DNA invertase Pin-like site-specific DNA recombinase